MGGRGSSRLLVSKGEGAVEHSPSSSHCAPAPGSGLPRLAAALNQGSIDVGDITVRIGKILFMQRWWGMPEWEVGGQMKVSAPTPYLPAGRRR